MLRNTPFRALSHTKPDTPEVVSSPSLLRPLGLHDRLLPQLGGVAQAEATSEPFEPEVRLPG